MQSDMTLETVIRCHGNVEAPRTQQWHMYYNIIIIADYIFIIYFVCNKKEVAGRLAGLAHSI